MQTLLITFSRSLDKSMLSVVLLLHRTDYKMLYLPATMHHTADKQSDCLLMMQLPSFSESGFDSFEFASGCSEFPVSSV